MFADAMAVANEHSMAFQRAFSARDAQAILALYADDARVVWPGEGDEASGRVAIARLVDNLVKSSPGTTLTLKSQEATALGARSIAIIGHWEHTITLPDGKTHTFQIRTSEVLRKDGDVWLYVIDHASIGLLPPRKQ